MLGSAVPSTATLHTSTSSATPTSPTRSSRLRGLSYLRNYTREHLANPAPAARNNTASSSLRRSRSSEGLIAGAANSPPIASLQSLQPSRGIHNPSRRRREPQEEEGGTEDTIHNVEKGWVPTVQGRATPEPLHPSPSTELALPEQTNTHTITNERPGMTRGRAASAQVGPTPTSPVLTPTRPPGSSPLPRLFPNAEGMYSDQTPATSTSNVAASAAAGAIKDTPSLPTIRFIPHIESRSSRPSLNFTALSRTLQTAHSVVRVGRYSERDTTNNSTTSASSTSPVGFKSKVVSRKHCEFWYSNSQWYIRDVKSSSGTFLNHVRLSSPGVESRPFPVNDGDVVQLGIDFKGGEEVIFRCVKIRIECNRGWQKSLNSFNTTAHKALLKSTSTGAGAEASNSSPKAKTKSRDADAASATSSECSICLNNVAPLQALFVAPCGHVWHYKCVRNLIHGPSWPNFLCPNCRFVADLEADVEAPEEEEEEEYTSDDMRKLVEGRDVGREELGDDNDDGERDGGGDDEVGDGVERTVDEVAELLRERYAQLSIRDIPDEELAALLGRPSLHTGNRARSTTEVEETQLIDVERTTSDSASSHPIDIIGGSGSSNHHEHQQTAAEAGDELAHARSTTPTSSAQFALAAGVMDMSLHTTGGASSLSEKRSPGGEPRTPTNSAGPFLLHDERARSMRDEGLGQG